MYWGWFSDDKCYVWLEKNCIQMLPILGYYFSPCIDLCYLNLIPDVFSIKVSWNIKIKISKQLSSYKYLLYIVNKVNLLEYLRTHNYQIHKCLKSNKKCKQNKTFILFIKRNNYHLNRIIWKAEWLLSD